MAFADAFKDLQSPQIQVDEYAKMYDYNVFTTRDVAAIHVHENGTPSATHVFQRHIDPQVNTKNMCYKGIDVYNSKGQFMERIERPGHWLPSVQLYN